MQHSVWKPSAPRNRRAYPTLGYRFAFRSKSYQLVNLNPYSRENTMRTLLETMFAQPFPKARPDFLRNPATGYPLELDAFNSDLKLGAEFHGVQHYEFPNPFHTNRAQFEAQCGRDKLKVQLCEASGITLVVVPHTVARQDIETFLRHALASRLTPLPSKDSVELSNLPQ